MVMSDRGARSIGEVINLLRDDFPDVSVSKIRFLESQGLIRPSRTSSGYRQFYDDDVERLKFILRQQRDHFLPLKVIKSKLTLWERGEEWDEPEASAPRVALEPAEGAVSRAELARRAALSQEQLAALEEYGIVQPVEGSDEYSEQALNIAIQSQRLLSYGLEARHLRTVRLAAEREAELLGQLTTPLRRSRNPETRRRLEELLAGSFDAIERMHIGLLSSLLQSFLEE